MGVNYYLFQPQSRDGPLHIGKSSGGCCFALHVIPEMGINTLDDWRKLWFAPGAVIRDSRNDAVRPEMMAIIVAARTWSKPLFTAYTVSVADQTTPHTTMYSETSNNA